MKKRKSAFMLLAAALLTLSAGKEMLLTAYAEKAPAAADTEATAPAADTEAAVPAARARQGWVREEDGVWLYYNNDGELVTESWKKDGEKRYYLDETGEMAVDRVIEYDGEKYYCDSTGAMVKNTWISVPILNDDRDWDAGVDTVWYYFRSNGEAYRDGKKKIGGQSYIFDDEGRMLSGWQTVGPDADWCYLGEEDEGFLYTGWQKLAPDDRMEGDYDEKEWFYLQNGSGKAYRDTKKKINGSYYSFDENGVMKDKWQVGAPGAPDYTDAVTGKAASGSSLYQEDGSMGKGWVYTYAPDDVTEEDEKGWFYLDKDGVPFNYHGKDSDSISRVREWKGVVWGELIDGMAAKVISGKTYLFDSDGRMQTGFFYLIKVPRTGGSTLGVVPNMPDLIGRSYYFNDKKGTKEGQMMTGKQSFTQWGKEFHCYFSTDGSSYAGVIADGSLYDYDGLRSDSKDPIEVVLIGPGLEIVEKETNRKLRNCSIIVDHSGKVTKSGTVIIRGVKYTVEDYEVVSQEPAD